MIKIKDKKALSAVIATLIIITLVIVSIGIEWSIINNLLKEQIGSAESCFNIFDKVTIGGFTCYRPGTDPSTDPSQIDISLVLEDIDIEDILISVSGEGKTESFMISELGQVPGKNSGKTYTINIADIFDSDDIMPSSVKIAPLINGEQCPATDSLAFIDDCRLLQS